MTKYVIGRAIVFRLNSQIHCFFVFVTRMRVRRRFIIKAKRLFSPLLGLFLWSKKRESHFDVSRTMCHCSYVDPCVRSIFSFSSLNWMTVWGVPPYVRQNYFFSWVFSIRPADLNDSATTSILSTKIDIWSWSWSSMTPADPIPFEQIIIRQQTIRLDEYSG